MFSDYLLAFFNILHRFSQTTSPEKFTWIILIASTLPLVMLTFYEMFMVKKVSIVRISVLTFLYYMLSLVVLSSFMNHTTRPSKLFLHNNEEVTRVFQGDEFIWNSDYEAMESNILPYERTNMQLTTFCQSTKYIVEIEFGGTPEEMLSVFKRFEMPKTIQGLQAAITSKVDLSGGMCGIEKDNFSSLLLNRFGENIQVNSVLKVHDPEIIYKRRI
ncbi:hypothetical protein ACFL08_04980 [Patescibacteria group bacterium]